MISQESIYQHILKFYPQEGKRYINPLRPDDDTPGVYFRRKGNYLRMVDNGWGEWKNVNCFDLWNIWKRSTRICCPDDFRLVRKEIASEMNANEVKIERYEDEWQYELTFKDEPFTYEDLKWWLQFGITEEQLRSDDVYSVESFEFNVRGSDIKYRIVPQDLCFGYIVENKKIHIYRPQQSKDSGKKFRTTVTREMVSFPKRTSDVLLILGSYKDGRVAYNCTNYDVKARMAEGMLPTEHDIRKMCNKYKYVVFIGDDDEAGHAHLKDIKNKLHLPNIYYSIPPFGVDKDVAGCYKERGKNTAAKLLNEWKNYLITNM